ncbi:cytochrome P450 [Fusarium venenatum]|uniref:cytochrome P450 n=1 Tax=Fusarium venenatum TaxID=56646 RepID=UPI001DFC09A1|nr:cytochrome P450 [Fusarium venenatum]
MTESSTLLFGVCVSLAAYIGLRIFSNDPKRFPLPPGPKGLPLLGNLKDLPPSGVLEAFHWLKHKDLYGPISSVTVMGQTIVIINDAELAFDLLDKRSAKHSSRPTQIFAGEMIGWENSLALSGYNDRFRTYRKNIARIIGSKTAAAQYDDLEEAEVSHFLLHVLDHPGQLIDHIRKEAGAIILKIAYGYRAEPLKEDLLINMVGKAMDNFGTAAVPGAFLVDVMPFLRYLPDWIPGAGFKRLARQWASELNDVAEKPYAFVQHQISHGKQDNSLLAQLLEAGDSTDEEKITNKWSAASLYAAGADTTVSAIACFFLAMSLFPNAQKAAQDEIDRVIGNDRLPTFTDRPNLPYIEALVKEVLRWHPVAPMGLPHTSTVEDIFAGYLIPKGSMVMANIWYFLHNPEVYDEPMRFKPERFLPIDGQPEQDPRAYVFGFGRRLCPGRVLAENTLFLNIAQSLAVFNVSTHENATTREVLFTPGIVSHPESFQATITPRSVHHEKLIRRLEQKHPWETSDSHILYSMKTQN